MINLKSKAEMKKVLFFLFLVLIVSRAFSQTESQIPFLLNSDTDPQINVIDIDDDNDGVLDNLDFSPLNPSTSGPTILSTVVTTIADAGLRNKNKIVKK